MSQKQQSTKTQDIKIFQEEPATPMSAESAARALHLLSRWATRRAQRIAKNSKSATTSVTSGVKSNTYKRRNRQN